MIKTKRDDPSRTTLLITTEALMTRTGLGRMCAIRLGQEANAEVRLGRLRRWSLSKIEKYLNE